MGGAFVFGIQRTADDRVREEFAARRTFAGDSRERDCGNFCAGNFRAEIAQRELGARHIRPDFARDAGLVSAGGISFLF